MRIAVVSPYDLGAPGGVQDQVVALVRGLRESGHDSWAVAPGSGGPEGTRHAGAVMSIPANRSRAPITLDPRAARRVRAAVADADVVHVHEPFMPVVSAAALAAAAPPVVATFHADPSPLVRRLYRGGGFLGRRLLRRAAVVTAVSPVAASAVSHLVTPRIVPNGIDVAAFDPNAAPVPGRVVFLGRDEPRKGLDVLLQAWPLIRAGRTDRQLRVLGARRPGGPLGVTFLGRVDAASKRAELEAAAVFCAPNLGGESFGIVVAEAMAAGCAVVASDLEAFGGVGGEAIVTVPPGDVSALAAAVAGLLDDPAEIERLSAAAAARADRFDFLRVREAYLGCYREATGTAR
jgi:phosphatidylinositol alpha-mannosyltransferase